MNNSIISDKIDVLDENWSSRAKGYKKLAKRILKSYSKEEEVINKESNDLCGCDFLDSEYGVLLLGLSRGWGDNDAPKGACVKEGGSVSYNGEQFCIRRN